VLMVRLVGKVGLPEGGTKSHDAPLGSGPVHAAKSRGPPQEPEVRVMVMVLEPDEPATTVISPDVDTVTVQDGG